MNLTFEISDKRRRQTVNDGMLCMMNFGSATISFYPIDGHCIPPRPPDPT